MKKIFAVCLTAAVMASALVGCGSEPAPASSVPAASSASVAASASTSAEKNLQDMLATIEAANPIANPLEFKTHEDEVFTLENEVLLTMSNVADFAIAKSNDQGNSGTILIVKAVAGKAADVKTELAAYQEAQINFYGNYAEFADGQANIKEGRIVENGDYVVMVFASLDADYAAIDKAVEEALN